ncbi:P2X purinoceptor 7 [Myripristis murdjan]|uniref:P2X purinoceptor 7 n=1 Tax=Myripristis murdjan TaxID=586833 RepID=UPI001175FC99|nr:P2X purinoceptor 7-like [Myripristis murdjan]
MSCVLPGLCQYDTNKLVRIQSVRLGSLKWTLNGLILLVICIMMLWNKNYQVFDLVVSSVTTKVKGVAQTRLPGLGDVVWDAVDYSGPSQDKNSFFVVTNVIVTMNQKQGKCPEVPASGRLCHTDKDCEKGAWDQKSHGVQTGSCVRADGARKTCEVSAWCPIETKTKPPRPALLAAAENFTVLIKNNIRFPAFNYNGDFCRPLLVASRNYNTSDLSGWHRAARLTRPLDLRRPVAAKNTRLSVPQWRRGRDRTRAEMQEDQKLIRCKSAESLRSLQGFVGKTLYRCPPQGGVIGIQIKWECNLDRLAQRCLPRYSFRRLDEKESNKTLYPGLNFRFAKYKMVNGVEERTLYKAFGIRFDVMVFGKAGRFSLVQLIIYIGSTLSYYALTTVFIDWLIGTSCYSMEARQNYAERKVEPVQDKQKCIVSVSFVDENHIRLVKRSQKKSLQDIKPICTQPCKEDAGHLRAMVCVLQPAPAPASSWGRPGSAGPAWCRCGCCVSSALPQEHLCCRRTDGPCITSAPLFERLVLRRDVLEAVLMYRDPLCAPAGEGLTAVLRHCAYGQYISWRFGVPPADSHPAVPSCCVWRIREEYPNPDGRYSGFRPAKVASTRSFSNKEP